MTQQPLPLSAKRQTRLALDLLPSVIGYLSDRWWVKGKQIEQRFAISDRVVREIASQSKGQIVSGQKGYALVWQVPSGDVHRSARWKISQGKEMIQRGHDELRMLQRGPFSQRGAA
jgi:hypothetical protein